MHKVSCFAAAIVLVVGVMGGSAFAQRTASDKFLGHFGHGFWGTYPRSGEGFYYYNTPIYTANNSYRSFSYQPIGIRAGEKVQVVVDRAKLMDGRRLVAKVSKGQEFEVQKVTNGWLRATIKQDGKTLDGWVWHDNVQLANAAKPVPKTNQ